MRGFAFLLTLLAWLAPSFAASAAGASMHDLVDMAGRTIAVPTKVERVACLEVLCYQKMFMLGASDRITEMTITTAPWMIATNPKVATIPKITPDPNFEDLLVQKVDVAFFAYNARQSMVKLESLGLPGLLSQPQTGKALTAEGYIAENKRSIRLFGKVLGGEAEARAEEWCAFLDDRVRRIATVVGTIPPERRLKVYYLRGPQAVNTQGIGSATYWFGELGGASMAVNGQPWVGNGTISLEDVAHWNPDVILVGRQYPMDLVLKDERWAGISAVRNGRVYPTPEGAFYWDGGLESVLFMEFVAWRLYPERFPDLDMVAELKDFYRRFYRYPLTDSEARLLLEGVPPTAADAMP